MTSDPKEFLSALHDEMCGWRHHLHSIPELAFDEHKTAAFVGDLLESWGLETHRGIGGTGIVAVVGPSTGPTIGLRADLDALPLHESPEAEPRSAHDGVMHACGHDAHTAMLLGAAKYLSLHQPSNVRVVMIFQPAEENEGGASAMIADGLFDRFPVDEVFGLHNMPGEKAGEIEVLAGAALAAFDTFDITIISTGGHSSMPHLVSNPTVVAADITAEIQRIPAATLSGFDRGVIAVCSVHAGQTYNVIPNEAELKGSFRYFDQDIGDRIADEIRSITSALAQRYQVEIDVTIDSRYAPTVNDPAATNAAGVAAEKVMGKPVDTFMPLMGSEDFGELAADRPGAMSLLRIGADSGPIHSPTYTFNDEVLTAGAEFWIRLVEAAPLSPAE